MISTPPPYSVETSHVSGAGAPGARPTPGRSIHPSTVYADPVAGCTVTKPPELSETSPTSVTIATRAAAIAASTAEPPARAIASAASAASWLGAATARGLTGDRSPVLSAGWR